MERPLTGREGYSLIEAILVLAIAAMTIYLASASLLDLAPKYRLEKAVREVRAALNTARAKSILDGANYRVRLRPESYAIEKFDDAADAWRPDSIHGLEGVTVETNNTPVFTPEGSVTNLATIRILNDWGGYRLTLAITGRVKIARIGP